MRRVLIATIAAVTTALAIAGPAWAGFGLAEEHGFEVSITNQDGTPDTQAGSHPFAYTTTLALRTEGENIHSAGGDTRDIEVELPPGLVGAPGAVPTCAISVFAKQQLSFGDSHPCPDDTQLGVAVLQLNGFKVNEPVYNLTPPKGAPAEFGFIVLTSPVVLVPSVRTGSDYGVSVRFSSVPDSYSLVKGTLTLWGVPADPAHNAERGKCLGGFTYEPNEGECPVSVAPKPFLSLPTSCTGPLQFKARVDSWEEPGVWSEEETSIAGMTGCDKLGFAPSLVVAPEPAEASAPSGLNVEIQVPQTYESAAGLATANLEDTTVTLPAGVALNPSAADGLVGCSEAQIGLDDGAAAQCPNASKVGTVEITTPLLAHPFSGGVYLAQQGNLAGNGSNPFGSLLAIYLAAEDPISGVIVKLAGEVKPDPATGQLVTTFLNNPQLPFDSLTLSFFGGPRAPLVNPPTCGTYTASAQMTPWSGGAAASPPGTFQITSGAEGSSCLGGLGFAPTVASGTTSNQAGAFTPFSMTLDRTDAEQNPSRIQVTTPLGLIGELTHVVLCGEPAAQQGACGEASLIGHVTVGVGAGSNPFYVTGKVYLTGGYNGAPYGLSFVVPAVAGPLNLGTVVVRAAVSVDPHSAALTVTSEPLPQILQGIPLHIRAVNVSLDRSEFIMNPTSCSPLALQTTLSSTLGASVTDSTHFQVTNCAALQFAPEFHAYTAGHTSRLNGASLDARLSFPKAALDKSANIAKVKVELPKQLPSRLHTLQQACPGPTFDKNPEQCPAGSRIGIAKAHTPVLPVPLEGPVYFVSRGQEWPQLVAVLQGYGVRVNLVGETLIQKGVTSSTFAQVPDVPVETFELYLPQGPNSALAAIGNLCNHPKMKMPTTFQAQDGKVLHQATPIQVTGCTKNKTSSKHKPKQKGNAAHNTHTAANRREHR
jgi:hypothetical protein